MIRVQGLQKSYASLRAVDGIDFEVPSGELFGLLGPNGAGKTTTLSMISGVLKPDSGRVSIADVDVWEAPKQAKRLLGMVPQDLALYEELTARENLMFWGSLFGLSRPQLRKNADAWLERVGLQDRAKEPVSRFSGGMKRRLNLAIGLVHAPKVVLLDEPTVGIDPQARSNILDLVRTIASEGTTILFTTHHLEEAEALCDRIAIMDSGRILETGSVAELAAVAGDGDIITVKGAFTVEAFRKAVAAGDLAVLNAGEGTGTVSMGTGGPGIAALLQALSDAGIELSDVSIKKPSLESVFLKLTGRQLRD